MTTQNTFYTISICPYIGKLKCSLNIIIATLNKQIVCHEIYVATQTQKSEKLHFKDSYANIPMYMQKHWVTTYTVHTCTTTTKQYRQMVLLEGVFLVQRGGGGGEIKGETERWGRNIKRETEQKYYKL